MTVNARLPEYLNILGGFAPIDLGSGNNEGDWVNCAGYAGVTVLLFKAAGTAGQDPTLTIEQATDNTGTGAKALNIPAAYRKTGNIGSGGMPGGAFTVDKPGDASGAITDNTWSLAIAPTDLVLAVHFRAEEFDIGNDFSFIRGSVADTGAAAQLGGLLYLFDGPRHGGGAFIDATS